MPKYGHNQGIVVGVAGSPASNAAVCWAARDAVMRRVPLNLVHISSPPVSPWAQAPLLEEYAAWQQHDASRILDDAVKIDRDAANHDKRILIESEMVVAN